LSWVGRRSTSLSFPRRRVSLRQRSESAIYARVRRFRSRCDGSWRPTTSDHTLTSAHRRRASRVTPY
jgi:hypothetical protein